MSGLGDRTLSGITGPGLMRRSLGVVRVDLALSMVTALVRQLAFLAIPWVLGRAVDAVVQDKDIDSTARWAGLLILVVLAESAGIIGWSWWSGLAHARMAAELRRRILGHVVTLDEGSYGAAGFGVGDVSIRGSRDVDSIGLWVRGLATWVVIGTTFVVLLPAMFALDPMLLVVTLAVIPLLIAVNVVMPPWFRRASNLLAASHSARADAVQELLTATLPVRGIGGEAALLARHHRHSEVVTERTLGAGRVGGVWSAVASFVPKAAVVAGVAVGGFAVAEGRVGVGALTTFALWMATITLATQVLVDRLSERGDAGVAARRVAEVFALRGTVPEPSHPVPVPAGGALEAHEVVCRRDGRIVCGPISLRVEPGTWLAISGVSGSGKTTLLRVLRRAADPSSGVVRVGGVALTDVTSDDIRARVALVAQRPTLFSGTLANNLCPDGDRTDDEIRRACRVAAFDSVVDESPDGLSTAVGENGVTLSGGQRQRLAIARAVLTDPHVILLDDATSALDVPTERFVLDRLREWSAGRVVVFASHRDAVSAAADHHLELPAPPAVTDADRIVEVGTGVDVAR